MMFHRFMRTTLPAVLGYVFTLSLIGVVIWAFLYAKWFAAFGTGYAIMAFVTVILFSGVFVILAFGAFHALLDIRDALERKEP